MNRVCAELGPETCEVITHDPWPNMPFALFNECSEYARWAADKIGLRDWLLLMMFETSDQHLGDSEAGACCQVIYGRKVLQIWLSEDFAQHPRVERQHMILHELFHAHTNTLLMGVEPTLRIQLGGPAWDMLYASYRERSEILTDTLAVEFGRLLTALKQEKPSEETIPGSDGPVSTPSLDRLSTDHHVPTDASGPISAGGPAISLPGVSLADGPDDDGTSLGDHPPISDPEWSLGTPLPRGPSDFNPDRD
jgi:hypothetical protein